MVLQLTVYATWSMLCGLVRAREGTFVVQLAGLQIPMQ